MLVVADLVLDVIDIFSQLRRFEPRSEPLPQSEVPDQSLARRSMPNIETLVLMLVQLLPILNLEFLDL